jgi:hypothetical protein
LKQNLLDGSFGSSHNFGHMKRILVATFALLLCCAPAMCQQQLNAATKEDVEEFLTLMGVRALAQQMWSHMGQQVASTAADSYRLKHPNATPVELRKVAEATSVSFQSSMKVVSIDELIDAMVPVYQEHLTHADMRSIIDFYNTEPGQKYLSQMPAMTAESMNIASGIVKKHRTEMQAAAEKAIADSVKDAPTNGSAQDDPK